VAVADYTQVNQIYNGINGPVPIILTALPSDTAHVKSSFTNLNLALSTFENHFGPYMWNRVGYCMVPFNSGAMEHATNISYPLFAADGTLNYQTLYAHELSHHWFGDLATCRTQEDMWLNEGWARYCEFLFTEALSGQAAYQNEIRTNHEENLHFLHVKEGGFLTLSNIPFNFTYGDHVYNKGADIAHTMRGYMGDSLFFYSVKTYLSQNNYKDVSSTDFRDALTTASGMDMTDFFNDWVFNPGWPHFSIDSFTVVPNGLNYIISIYVKQKLTGAPNYFTNVPLDITFKAPDWTEQTEKIIMSGSNATFNFTIPFSPAFVALNMDEKISHAIAPDYKKIKTTGASNFVNARMNIVVQSITDSAFIRVEHNYAAPDGFKSCCHPYRLSPNHYWKVDGILPSTFKAKATINYDGRTTSFSGNLWLDNNLINTVEDSLVLMYRKNTADEWMVYPYYSKNIINNNNDKRGVITIDTLKLGEYVFAMKDYTMGIQIKNLTDKFPEIRVFPNPTKELLTIDLAASSIKIPNNAILTITDTSGKISYKENLNSMQNSLNIKTSAYSSGVYFISINANGVIIAKSKFIIAH
jgi:aminopeptidase N